MVEAVAGQVIEVRWPVANEGDESGDVFVNLTVVGRGPVASNSFAVPGAVNGNRTEFILFLPWTVDLPSGSFTAITTMTPPEGASASFVFSIDVPEPPPPPQKYAPGDRVTGFGRNGAVLGANLRPWFGGLMWHYAVLWDDGTNQFEIPEISLLPGPPPPGEEPPPPTTVGAILTANGSAIITRTPTNVTVQWQVRNIGDETGLANMRLFLVSEQPRFGPLIPLNQLVGVDPSKSIGRGGIAAFSVFWNHGGRPDFTSLNMEIQLVEEDGGGFIAREPFVIAFLP